MHVRVRVILYLKYSEEIGYGRRQILERWRVVARAALVRKKFSFSFLLPRWSNIFARKKGGVWERRKNSFQAHVCKMYSKLLFRLEKESEKSNGFLVGFKASEKEEWWIKLCWNCCWKHEARISHFPRNAVPSNIVAIFLLLSLRNEMRNTAFVKRV